MRLRKIISLLIAVVMLSVSCVGAFAENDNLTAVGITSGSLTGEADGFISRAEFSYLISKMMTDNDMQPTNTKFTDVTEKNPYSGYIAYLNAQGVVNGVDGTKFAPDAYVEKEAAAKIIVHVLGFKAYAENNGGYPNGYLLAAERLGIFDDLFIKEQYITRSEALSMMENSLLAINGNKAFTFEQSYEGFEIPDEDDKIFLTTQLGYSVYRGQVKSVNVKNNSMTFYVEKNEYETNHVLLEKNTEVILNVSTKIDLAHYDKVPVIIWTNSDGEVTLIRERNGYSIEYGVIETVNGDNVLSSPYEISAIERMTLVGYDTEMLLSSDTEFYYNGIMVSGGVDLSDCFVRMIVKSGEATSVFCYKTEDGGLIENISAGEKQITYKSGTVGSKRWNEAKDAEQLLVYIDGRVASFEELKIGSVFSYYCNDNVCIIVVCERIAVDVFKTYSANQITLGAFTYKTDDCVYSKDGLSYKTGDIVYELLSGEVTAYFAPNGKVAFVKKSNGESRFERFYGIVNGIDEPKGLEENSEIELYKVGETVEKNIYTITEKTAFKDNLSLSALGANAKNADGEGVYYFTVNGKGEITEIENCTPFTGYGSEAKATMTSFTNEILPVVTMPNNKQLYFQGTPIIALYEENGEFIVSGIEWTSIYGRGAGGTVTMEFYSKEEEPQPDIAILCGVIGNMTESENVFGVVLDKSLALNAEGETVNTVEIMASNGTRTYYVSKETADRLSVDDFVSFAKRLTNNEDQIILSEVIDMSGEIDDWKISLTQDAGLQRGKVRRIDPKRLYIESATTDDVYFMHPYSCFVLAADSEKNEKFSTITAADIDIGEIVCYYLVGGEIRVIIVEK